MAPEELHHAILDKALELAEGSGWEALRLHDVAASLEISLDQLREHYAQKDDLVEAWYDRADSAMLKAAEEKDFLNLDIPQRLHTLIMRWFDTLAQHKTVSRDMLLYKLEPGHVHLQVLGVLRISRTVQWLREAARLDTTHLLRVTEEIGLTSIYLMTFLYWMSDYSENQKRTRTFLEHKLRRAGLYIDVLRDWLPRSAPWRVKTEPAKPAEQ